MVSESAEYLCIDARVCHASTILQSLDDKIRPVVERRDHQLSATEVPVLLQHVRHDEFCGPEPCHVAWQVQPPRRHQPKHAKENF